MGRGRQREPKRLRLFQPFGGERALVAYNNVYARASGWIRVSAYYAEILPDGNKHHVQRTLAEALGLSGKDGRFLVFREQRSGLWFLRPSPGNSRAGAQPGPERIREPGLPGHT